MGLRFIFLHLDIQVPFGYWLWDTAQTGEVGELRPQNVSQKESESIKHTLGEWKWLMGKRV